MKARVNTYLNVRTGTPEILPYNNPNDAFFRPGDVVEIVETMIGEEYKGNDVWHKIDSGVLLSNFGVDVDKNLFFKENVPLSTTNDLSKKIILNGPIGKNGKGVTIGILDSGIDTGHPDLKAAMIGQEEDCLTLPHDPTIINSHGTKVAGILVGNNQRISGLAIDAKIRSFRVADRAGNTDDAALKIALGNISKTNMGIDILNLSLDIKPNYIPVLTPIFDDITNAGIIVVAAGYNADYGNFSNLSKIKSLIHIGIFQNEGEFINFKNSRLPSEYDIALFNESIESISLLNGNDPDQFINSSSAYTAVTSGLIAKFLSNKFISKQSRSTEVRNYLKSISFDIKKEPNFSKFKPLRNETG